VQKQHGSDLRQIKSGHTALGFSEELKSLRDCQSVAQFPLMPLAFVPKGPNDSLTT
jgi:hypothetical protein